MHHEASIDIERPPDDAWPVLVDVERWPEWTASVTSVERLDDGVFGLGSRVRIRQPRLPTAEWEVTGFEPGESFTWTSVNRGLTSVGVHRLVDLGDGRTRLKLSIDQDGWLAPLVRLFWSRMTQRYVQTEAEGLKRRVESG